MEKCNEQPRPHWGRDCARLALMHKLVNMGDASAVGMLEEAVEVDFSDAMSLASKQMRDNYFRLKRELKPKEETDGKL